VSVAHWSWRRLTTVCLAWLLGFLPLAVAALYARTALLNPAPDGHSREAGGGLEIVLEYPSTAATLLTALWLGPPLLLIAVWLHVRVRGGKSDSP